MKTLKIILLSTIFLIPTAVFGQSQSCSADSIRNISSRGITLGITFDKAVKILDVPKQHVLTYQNSIEKHNYFGFWRMEYLPSKNDKFADVLKYELSFFDKKLVGFSVIYSKPKWESIDEFAANAVRVLKLPLLDKWKTSKQIEEEQSKTGSTKIPEDIFNGYVLSCENHSIALGRDFNDGEFVRMSVSGGQDYGTKMLDRQNKTQTEQKIFKP